ncbi:MAG: hypothetical protein LBS25_04435 [Candidatus Symbiothrix sp.]|jgi:hypothetical protein|nr:hypothetical protein [Candidatus Symbiothrix sp.]
MFNFLAQIFKAKLKDPIKEVEHYLEHAKQILSEMEDAVVLVNWASKHYQTPAAF